MNTLVFIKASYILGPNKSFSRDMIINYSRFNVFETANSSNVFCISFEDL